MVKKFEQFPKDCSALGKRLVRAEKTLARDSALGLKEAALNTTSDAAPAFRLSGVGKRGAAIGISSRQVGPTTYFVKATGPYQLIERDTVAHTEPRKVAGSRLRKGRKRKDGTRGADVLRKRGVTLSIPGIGYRQWAKHPGTKGKRPFATAVFTYSGTVPIRFALKRVTADIKETVAS